MVDNKTRYKLKIGDQTYTIIGTESKSHMKLVGELVNEQLSDIQKLAPQTTNEQAAILLAINAISDQLKKEERNLQLEKECADLRVKADRLEEVELRLQKIENVEERAKQVLKQTGEQKNPENHIEAQQILNKQVKEKIQKTHHPVDNK